MYAYVSKKYTKKQFVLIRYDVMGPFHSVRGGGVHDTFTEVGPVLMATMFVTG